MRELAKEDEQTFRRRHLSSTLPPPLTPQLTCLLIYLHNIKLSSCCIGLNAHAGYIFENSSWRYICLFDLIDFS